MTSFRSLLSLATSRSVATNRSKIKLIYVRVNKFTIQCFNDLVWIIFCAEISAYLLVSLLYGNKTLTKLICFWVKSINLFFQNNFCIVQNFILFFKFLGEMRKIYIKAVIPQDCSPLPQCSPVFTGNT